MDLIGLPTELLQLLAEFLETEKDISALSRTCRHCYFVFIPCLYRFDHKKKNSFALMWAAKKGNESTAWNSIQYGATQILPDKFGRTPLSYAATEGHEAIVKQLLNIDGVDSDSKDDYGWTPLAKAASEGHDAIVKLLLNIDGVDPDSKDKHGSTPLFWTALRGHEAIVNLLLKTGRVDPASRNDRGAKSLSQAIPKVREALVKLLQGSS